MNHVCVLITFCEETIQHMWKIFRFNINILEKDTFNFFSQISNFVRIVINKRKKSQF